MAVTQGYKSYFIVGAETTWNIPAILSETETVVYEFVSSTLKNNSELIVPERFRGHPSAVKGIENIVEVGGDIVMHLHADNMIFWWKQISYDTSPSSEGSTDKTLRETSSWTTTMSLQNQPTSQDCDPALLKFVFSTSVTGTITIVGTDQNDAVIRETISLSNQTTKTTTKYFKTVNSNGITTTIAPIQGETLTISGNRNVTTYTFELQDDLTNGFTIELVKGDYPSVYTGCLVNSASVRLADVITATLGIIGSRGYNFAKLSTSSQNRTPVPSATPSSLEGFSRITDVVFQGWGTKVELDIGSGSTVFPVTDVTLNMNNNLRFPERFTGTRFRNVKPIRGGLRDYSLTLSLDYDASANFDDLFFGSQEISAVVTCKRLGIGGADKYIKFTLPRCEIRAYPDPAVDNFAEILQEITLTPLRSSLEASDELSIEVRS